ncbi:MAG: 2-oxoglutarate dehydrogenase complex dihydrolipoyllysine-residue succinyltransferase [Candidatus Aquirickettsiella sp.]
MRIEIKVPMLPESVTDATLGKWEKNKGELVKVEDTLVALETDKVAIDIPAGYEGVLGEILKKEGSVVKSGEVLVTLDTDKEVIMKATKNVTKSSPAATSAVAEALPSSVDATQNLAGPAARRKRSTQEPGSDSDKRVPGAEIQTSAATNANVPSAAYTLSSHQTMERMEKRVPMTRLRARIAERLVTAQHTAAILTTFNEINLQEVIKLRTVHKEGFEKKHGIRLGFMSFFTKAAIAALKNFPAVNASIDGNDVVYHNYFDIGIAVSTERGLVVPILRDADRLSFAEIEKAIANYGRKAKENQIAIEDMTGGTFTITNGGVFGSLLATPIINPPQSAILGMNKIEERPIVEKGQIVIRPMMYVALSYDHRIIDGKESVSFLKTIKEFLEDPARLLMDV